VGDCCQTEVEATDLIFSPASCVRRSGDNSVFVCETLPPLRWILLSCTCKCGRWKGAAEEQTSGAFKTELCTGLGTRVIDSPCESWV